MSGFYMLGRLLWRPAGWLMLLALLIASFAAGLSLAQGPQDLLAAGLYGEASRDQRLTLWRLATMLPALAGLLPSFSARELQHTFFAWTLPGLGRGLRTGKAVIGVAVAALMGIFAARMMGPSVAAAAFGWAVLWFTLGGVAFDPVRSKVESKGVVAMLVLLAYRADYVEQLALLQPLVFGAIAAIAAGVVLRHEFSPGLSRMRPLFGIPPTWTATPHGMRQYWTRSDAPARDWNGALANDSFLGWLRAGYYEAYGGVRRGWAGIGGAQISLAIAAAYFMDSPQMVVIMSWIILGTAASQLQAKLLYPLARQCRAKLFFVSSVLEIIAISALALAATAVFFALPPRGAAPYDMTVAETASFALFIFAWAPVGQWAKIRGPMTGENSTSTRLALRFFGFQILFVILVGTSVALSRRLAPVSPLSWFTIGVFAAGVYAIYWLAVSRHFRTRDLVFARG